MKLYDEQIKKADSLLCERAVNSFFFSEKDKAIEGNKSDILFRSETAFELGGRGLPSVCCVMFTSEKNVKDEICICGRDLPLIKGDCPFGHIITVGLSDDVPEEDFRFEELKDIEFSLYRIYPKGYNVSISPLSERELVRVGKKAIEGGLSFKSIGCNYIDEFKKHPLVKSVKVTFITDECFDYKALSVLSGKTRSITKAVTTQFVNQELDCASCSMKEICDEVEGLKMLHFKNK